jgi:aldose 1-epimerase
MGELPEASDGALPPSGRQFPIRHGASLAVVTEVGAGLRVFEIGDEPVAWGYPSDAMASGGRGQVLAPWPNRIEDGSYEWRGVSAHVPLDEPDRRNAIHGLLRWLCWDVVEHTAGRVTLSCELAPQPAYPWRLLVEVTYELDDAGLVVTAVAENRSETEAPYGMGFHPYLHAGPGGADACTLTLPARRRLLLDERGLPRGSQPVDATEYDFAAGRALAGVRLDDCFTDLVAGAEPAADGAVWQAVLARGDGRRITLWADASWPYVMCYTGDTLAAYERRRGVAVEPMTCPPNAFVSGQSVTVLGAGERWSGRFGMCQLD